MTRPTAFGSGAPQGVGGVGGDPALPPGQAEVDCCAIGSNAMPDRAFQGNTFYGVVGGDGTLVQFDEAEFTSGGPTLAYPSDTTAGNLLVATMVTRGGSSVPTLAGWTAVGGGGIVNPSEARMWWRVAPGGAVTVTPSTVDTVMRLCVMEFDGGAAGLLDSDSLTAQGPASSYDLPDLTVSAAAVMVGVVTGQGDNPNPITFTDDTGWTEVYQGRMAGNSLGPSHIVSRDVVSAGTHDYNPTGNHSVVWGGVVAAFDLGEGWVGGGYLAVDGDDATYAEITGTNVLRIWLGDAFAIARIRLLIGTETAGAKTYTLKGANAADYSDAVTVATLNWTATGSFTADEVLESWAVTDSYEFWELTGDDETRYVFSFELFEAGAADASSVQANLDDHIDDTTDAHDASAVSIVDAGGYFTGTDVETALQELGADSGSVGGFDVTPPQSVPMPAWVKPSGSGIITNDAQGRITIDSGADYKAFPSMAFLEGRLHLVYRQGTSHVSTGGVIKYRTSDDLGRTWTSATTIATPAGSDDNRDPIIGALSSGRLLLYYFRHDGSDALDIKVRYSDDRGQTWSAEYTVPDTFTGEVAGSGSIVELPDGTILISGYGESGATWFAVTWSSTDGGQTFGNQTTIATDAGRDYYEPVLRYLASGKLVALLRTNGTNHTYRAVSSDLGATWAAETDVLTAGEGRPDFVEFFPNALFLIIRQASGDEDAYWTVSWDGGATWSALQEVDAGETRDLEYSAPVVLAPGYIAVVYALETSGTDTDLYIRYYHDGYGMDPLGNITALSVTGTAPTTVDYLVGTASGSLSAEIVVGTTPGGDLGGTWGAPVVEAIQGVVVTDAGTTGDVLTKTGAATATWSTPASAGSPIGGLAIDSVHSTPLVFGDILQESDGSDFLYTSP